MNKTLSRLDNLKRPHLLIRAARIGLRDYRREVHLARQLGAAGPIPSQDALEHLMEIESDLDTSRQQARADYSVIHHVEVMIALLGEARLLRIPRKV